MDEKHSRTAMLLGDAAIEVLQQAHVCVFGLGGVGGYAVEALVRAGVGTLSLVDNDTVNESNLNRQIIATQSTLGKSKTQAFRERIHDINPDCKLICHDCFYLPEKRGEFDFSQYDYVVDAIDTISAKIDLVLACQEVNTPIISSMGAGNKLDPTRFEVADIYDTSVCKLAKVMRTELRKRGAPSLKCVYSKEPPINVQARVDETKPAEGDEQAVQAGQIAMQAGHTAKPSRQKLSPGSVSFVPSVAGLILAGEVIKDLTGKN